MDDIKKGEVGQVIEINDNKVLVKMERKEACAKCKACSVGIEGKEMRVTALNLCKAGVGDMVEIIIDNKDFVSASLIMYGFPLLGFVAGLFLGYFIAANIGLKGPEFYGMVWGLVFVALAYLIIRKTESEKRREKFIPRAVKIVE